MCHEAVDFGIEPRTYSCEENRRGVIPASKERAFQLDKTLGQFKTPTSTWPETFRQARIADGEPMLDAQQIPEWVQSLSALEQA